TRSPRASSSSARCEPMNPAPPVMRKRMVSLPASAARVEWVPCVAVHRLPSAYSPRFRLVSLLSSGENATRFAVKMWCLARTFWRVATPLTQRSDPPLPEGTDGPLCHCFRLPVALRSTGHSTLGRDGLLRVDAAVDVVDRDGVDRLRQLRVAGLRRRQARLTTGGLDLVCQQALDGVTDRRRVGSAVVASGALEGRGAVAVPGLDVRAEVDRVLGPTAVLGDVRVAGDRREP